MYEHLLVEVLLSDLLQRAHTVHQALSRDPVEYRVLKRQHCRGRAGRRPTVPIVPTVPRKCLLAEVVPPPQRAWRDTGRSVAQCAALHHVQRLDLRARLEQWLRPGAAHDLWGVGGRHCLGLQPGHT